MHLQSSSTQFVFLCQYLISLPAWKSSPSWRRKITSFCTLLLSL
jgi:hypothetical protein